MTANIIKTQLSTFSMAKAVADVKALMGGVPGSITDPPTHFDPKEILYYRLKVTLSGSSTSLAFNYSWESGSGRYNMTDIGAFVGMVVNSSLPARDSGLYGGDGLHPPAPNLFVRQQCYVVIDLVPGVTNLRFTPGVAAIDTKGVDYSDYYAGLTHLDSSLSVPTVYTVAPADDCTMVYFAVQRIVPAAPWTGDTNFNLHFQFDQASGGPVSALIDPAIKNRG